MVALFRDTLGYDYLGNWEEREGNRNIEQDLCAPCSKRSGQRTMRSSRALLAELQKAAGDHQQSLYDRNRAVYDLLRYGVKVKPDVGENNANRLADRLEDTRKKIISPSPRKSPSRAPMPRPTTKRPDVVLYVNGIALGVLELKRSTVSVAEGIRQNLDNQKKEFIQPFFSTMQLVMAGNDTEGLRYGTIQTPEKYYLTWKEDEPRSRTRSTGH